MASVYAEDFEWLRPSLGTVPALFRVAALHGSTVENVAVTLRRHGCLDTTVFDERSEWFGGYRR